MTGSCKSSGKHCPVYMNVNAAPAFTHLVTHETCKINHQLHRYEKFLIYLITCNQCLRQYMDQTIDSLRLKWNNYQKINRKFYRSEAFMQEHLFRHFCSIYHNGILNNASLTFMDKTNHTNPIKFEHLSRETLKTVAALGLTLKAVPS